MDKIKTIVLLLVISLIFMILTWVGYGAFKEFTNPKIVFNTLSADLDTLYRQEDAFFYFIYKNEGNSDLKIYNITTSCVCTIPFWNSGLLKRSETDSFKVEYNIENKGYFIKEILVYSNSPTSPDKLQLLGYVPFE